MVLRKKNSFDLDLKLNKKNFRIQIFHSKRLDQQEFSELQSENEIFT